MCLDFQRLMEDGLGHRRREECEGSVCHQLGDGRDGGKKIMSTLSFLFFFMDRALVALVTLSLLFFNETKHADITEPFNPKRNARNENKHLANKSL